MSSASEGRVLTAGSINTDLVVHVRRAPERGETVTGSAFATFGGGKGANQTLASVRSGAPTSILGAVGDDDFGRQRLADLERDGVDCQSVLISDKASSGVALITIEADGDNRIAYVPGATLTIGPNQAIEAINRVRPAAIMMTLELPHETMQTLITEGRRAGAVIILNATPEPAAGASLAIQADILIANETEALELLGWGKDERDWESAASALRELGPQNVIITLGAAGAYVLANEVSLIEPPRVEVVDTTGAGDAFCGAFAAQIAKGAEIEFAARAGVVAGALSVTKPGAQPSQPYWKEIVLRL
jgi:ribokinase